MSLDKNEYDPRPKHAQCPPPPVDDRPNPSQHGHAMRARVDRSTTTAAAAANSPADSVRSPEPGRAPTHDFALADQLGVELAAVEGEVDVEVDAVESALRGIHTLEVLFEVLAAEIGSQGDDFLNTCDGLSVRRSQGRTRTARKWRGAYVDPWCIPDRHPRRRRTGCPHTSTSPPAPPAGKS